MENRAATAWASARSDAADIVADLAIGDVISYDAAEDIGEQVFRELQVSLRQLDLVLIDDGDGHEVRHEAWEEHAAENSQLAARQWDRD